MHPSDRAARYPLPWRLHRARRRSTANRGIQPPNDRGRTWRWATGGRAPMIVRVEAASLPHVIRGVHCEGSDRFLLWAWAMNTDGTTNMHMPRGANAPAGKRRTRWYSRSWSSWTGGHRNGRSGRLHCSRPGFRNDADKVSGDFRQGAGFDLHRLRTGAIAHGIAA